jgi:hypothetical protein
MKSEGYDPEEIGARGRAIYEEKIRHLVIDTEKGKILVIDVESGDHEVDEEPSPPASNGGNGGPASLPMA